MCACLLRWYVCHLSPHDALREGGLVYHVCLATPWCTFLFLRLIPVFPALNLLGGKIACIVPTSSGRWSDVSTLGYCCWKTLPAPKRWSLWTLSCRWRSSALLLPRIISPFPIVLSIRRGVPRGLRAPSSSLHSPQGRFCLSPHIWRKGVESWWVRNPAQTLLAGPLVGKGILVPPPWKYAFFKSPFTAVYFRISAWFCWNFTVPSACSYAFPMMCG